MLSAPITRSGVLSVFSRTFALSAIRTNAVVNSRPSPKDFAVKDPKILAKRVQRKKAVQKEPAQVHPLYMDVPTAMRYMRAAEVGQPAKKTTVAVQLTVIPEKGSAPLQGKIFFPKPIKDQKVLVFTLDEATLAQVKELDYSIEAGGLDLVEKIQRRDIDISKFSQSYATPEIVASLRPLARILGPKGLLPTAKRGTVSDSLVELLNENIGAYNFKQKRNLLNIPVGRCDFTDEEIIRNIQTASDAVYGCQPPGTKKPNLIGRTYLSSTLGPAVVIDFKN